MTIERENLHRVIDELPQERLSELTRFVDFLQDEDDEPLSDSELEQLAASREDIAAGRVYSFEEVWKEHLSLP